MIIPACDEACNIVGTLEALFSQYALDGTPLDPECYEVLLLCNNCRDETAEIARDWSRRHPSFALHVIEAFFSPANSNVGYARRLLMDAAYQRLETLSQGERVPLAICSTDADTRVFPNYLAAILTEMSAGAEAVGGRILVSKSVGAPRAPYLRDTAYHLYTAHLESLIDPQSDDSWPRHFQFFGASMALSPRAYQAVGGLPNFPCLEDMALKKQLMRHDIALRHSPHVRVLTSARLDGRVTVGLSSQLREWDELESQNGEWLVPSGFELVTKLMVRRTLRALHSRATSGELFGEILPVAHTLGLDPLWLEAKLKESIFFGALWDDIEQIWNKNPEIREDWPPVPIKQAIEELRMLLEGMPEK